MRPTHVAHSEVSHARGLACASERQIQGTYVISLRLSYMYRGGKLKLMANEKCHSLRQKKFLHAPSTEELRADARPKHEAVFLLPVPMLQKRKAISFSDLFPPLIDLKSHRKSIPKRNFPAKEKAHC